MKIMGKREIGELDIGELVSTLLISEVAAIPIDDPDLPLMNAIIPIIFILSLEIIFSFAKTKSNKIKKIMEGSPVYLIYKGEINQRELTDNRLTINELLSEMHIQGISDIGDIEYGILEQNGKISLIKKSDDVFAHALIIDGEYNKDEMSHMKMTRRSTDKLLKSAGVSVEDVFLLSVNDKKEIKIIKKDRK